MSSTAGENAEMNSRFNYNCFPSPAAVICVLTDSLINADTGCCRWSVDAEIFFFFPFEYSLFNSSPSKTVWNGEVRLKFNLCHSNLDYSRNIHN